jgi:hypothetical protein
VWEEASSLGFIANDFEPGRGRRVSVSAAGWEHLRTHRAPAQNVAFV